MFINSIKHGDCLDLMMDIPSKSIDMILCDLPYGTTACKWDTVIPLNRLWLSYERIIKDNGAIVLTASQPFTSALVMSNPLLFKYELIWEKPNPSNPLLAGKRYMSFHESVLIFYKKQPIFNSQKTKRLDVDKRKLVTPMVSKPDILGGALINKLDSTDELKHPSSVIKISRQLGLHPTQKPVALFEYLIKSFTKPGDLVLDNCAGSGTTAIAALNTGRRYICIEKDEIYFNTIVNRVIKYNSPS
jgi:site-specific DNA-methyltransferase (adenine-specific)